MTSILPLDLPVYWKVQDSGVMQPAIEANTERETTTRHSIGCVLFAPIDLTERAISRDERGAPRSTSQDLG